MSKIITRYMSFPKFVSLLKDGLFIPNWKCFKDKWADKWEGLLPINIHHKEECVHSYNETIQSLAQWIYVSCWHNEECENFAMWKIYGQVSEAVAIETTIEKIKNAYLIAFPNSLAYLGEVTYIPRENVVDITFSSTLQQIGKRPLQVGIGQSYLHLKYFFLKDQGFEFEHEFRLVALDESFKRDMVKTKEGIFVNFRTVDSFIQKVRISPTAPRWFDDVVSDLLKKYDINTEIEHSRFSEQPPTL